MIRQTWYEAAVKNLSDQERLCFYEACFKFEFTGEEPSRKTCPYSTVLLMFDMVKVDLAKDAEKARNIAERNRANGMRGGRPAKDNEMQQPNQNPTKPNETQKNPAVLTGLPLHNTTQQNTTLQKESSSSSVLDGEFFNEQLWAVLDPEQRFRSRHRACLAMWLGMSLPKRLAITKALQNGLFAAGTNPYFYLQDFAEPKPRYLSGTEMDKEWKMGKSVYGIETDEGYKYVTLADVELFGLTVVSRMDPK